MLLFDEDLLKYYWWELGRRNYFRQIYIVTVSSILGRSSSREKMYWLVCFYSSLAFSWLKEIPRDPTNNVNRTNTSIGNNIVLSDSEGYEKTSPMQSQGKWNYPIQIFLQNPHFRGLGLELQIALIFAD